MSSYKIENPRRKITVVDVEKFGLKVVYNFELCASFCEPSIYCVDLFENIWKGERDIIYFWILDGNGRVALYYLEFKDGIFNSGKACNGKYFGAENCLKSTRIGSCVYSVGLRGRFVKIELRKLFNSIKKKLEKRKIALNLLF